MRYVRYIGLAHVRQITAQDWRSVGITGDTVSWSAMNGFAVPLDQLTDDQIEKGIKVDRDFVITGEGDDGEEFTPKPQQSDMTPSALQQVTENPVDVVGWANGGDLVSTDDSEASEAAPGGAAPTATTTGTGGGSDAPGTTVH